MKKIIISFMMLLGLITLSSCNKKEYICDLTEDNMYVYVDIAGEFNGIKSWGTDKWVEFEYNVYCISCDEKYIFENCVIMLELTNSLTNQYSTIRLELDKNGSAENISGLFECRGDNKYTEEQIMDSTTYEVIGISGKVYTK